MNEYLYRINLVINVINVFMNVTKDISILTFMIVLENFKFHIEDVQWETYDICSPNLWKNYLWIRVQWPHVHESELRGVLGRFGINLQKKKKESYMIWIWLK